MIFEQFYLECLSHASYLIGDETTGRAVVVDPQRDVGGYLAVADARGLHVERVIETHVHADFVSGHLELAARTGAVISYGTAIGDTAFPVDPLADGQRLSLGSVELEIRATPGHTPESISIVVRGHPDDPPFAVLTGDTLFIGDVGRPDLFSSPGADADALARKLYHSLHAQLLTLPDRTVVYPAHGAGSACGKHLSTETSSTIGDQRRTNYALQPMSEDAFVAAVTEGQTTAPRYFSFDAGRNREAHTLLDEHDIPTPMTLTATLAARNAGAVLLDTREPADFAAGHLQGAVNVGLQGRFAEYAGDVLEPEHPVVLVGDPDRAAEGRVRLGRIGFDDVLGALDDPFAAFVERPDLVDHTSVVTVAQLAEALGLGTSTGRPLVQLVDVRDPGETATGAVRDARLLPLPELTDRIGELDATRPTVVLCASGYRAAIATSVLAAAGFFDVSILVGGVDAWRTAGLPLHPPGEDNETMDVPPENPIPDIGPEEAEELTDALLLDVREADEWAAGHAPTATWIPMGELEARIAELPRDRKILAICRSGGRSAAVVEALHGAGFDAVNVAGGMQSWARSGLDVVADDGAAGTII